MKKHDLRQKEQDKFNRSPEVDRLLHDLKAQRFNYDIAIQYLSNLELNSTLAENVNIADNKEATWADHKGRLWLAAEPISVAERETLTATLEVIVDYERQNKATQSTELTTPHDKPVEKDTVASIAAIRAGKIETRDRLTEFNQCTKTEKDLNHEHLQVNNVVLNENTKEPHTSIAIPENGYSSILKEDIDTIDR